MTKVVVVGAIFNARTLTHDGSEVSRGLGGGAYFIYRALKKIGVEVDCDPLWFDLDSKELPSLIYQLNEKNDRSIIRKDKGEYSWIAQDYTRFNADILVIKCSLFNSVEFNTRILEIIDQITPKLVVYESSVSSTGKELVLDRIVSRIDVFIPSYIEAKAVFNTGDIDVILSNLEKMNIKVTGLKLAEKGSWLIIDGKRHFFKPFDVVQKDSTGAGDLYMAGIIYGIIQGMHTPKSGTFASALGALGVSKLGGEKCFGVVEVLKFIKETKKRQS